MTKLAKVKSYEEAWDLINADLSEQVSQLEGITFEGWPVFSLKVSGEKYNSSLTSAMLPAMYELQLTVNRLYAEITGRNIRNLTQQEKKDLEIIYVVSQGSSDVKCDLTNAANTIAGSLAKLKPGHWIAIAALFATTVASQSMYSSYLESEVSKSQNEVRLKELELQQEMMKRVPVAATIQKEVEVTTTGILRAVQDADSVELNNERILQDHIAEIVKNEQKPKSEKRLDGNYLITGWKVKEDIYRAELSSLEGGPSFSADLTKSSLNMEDQEKIGRAIVSELPINLKIFARVRANAVSNAIILGINSEETPTELLAHQVAPIE